MIPSTAPPFAMTRWSAMTRINNVSTCPYRYSDTAIHGFIGTHQPAIWMGEFGQVVVAPGVGDVKTNFADRGLPFTHDQETATPYYYKVTMHAETGQTITAETTATSRVGSMRFSFNSRSSSHVIVDATRETIEGEITISPNQREIFGRNPERQDYKLGPFKANNFNGYFVARFDQPFSSWGTITNGKMHENKTTMISSGLSAYVIFPEKTDQVNVRVGTSFISIEQARKNLDTEIPDGTTLEETSRQIESLWAEKLDRVNIEGASQDQLTILYTGMFHSLQYPNEKSESNETGIYYYSGYDDRVHKGAFSYTGYSIWDIFRAEWAFLIMFAPERVPGMITSMLQTYKESGRLPMWENLVETNIMVCTWASSMIAEALRKGIDDFDLDTAWKAVWKDAMVPPKDDLILQYYDREEKTPLEVRAGLTLYKKNGWVPAIRTAEAGTRTLEYAWADFSVAVVANYTGHKNESNFFLERSENYRHVFNNDTTFMEARMEDGSWNDDASTWTEGNKWIYTFNVPHNFSGLRSLFNGTEAFENKLDTYFQGGHNDQSNEPSHATPFAYLYANKPHKTQSVIRDLLQTSYNVSVDGLSGNEDCGQMSAWAFFNYLGFYPVNPTTGEYMIGTPAFDKVILDLPGRQQNLVISAPGAPSMPYVKSLYLDGRNALSKPILTHEQLMDAKEISFEMSETPQAWGRDTL
ncbi:hypothetical protein K450DRAFT_249990 [Umbelopsis ramanniana AG]|uniref:Glycoside hydrolase family 92 protein n=1 Tax=Umbelopsis ramanniana AG TaxID=1314678 RepID=A0AAD5HCR1_UMBRA|nr:uncharacterized protein K450DRAFT_249990 [Umbelopsis ramanniana AG]KAI8577786.1 hypothetical protein K450DRAFT_249990 [Umbelopsis ramanniana AG]